MRSILTITSIALLAACSSTGSTPRPTTPTDPSGIVGIETGTFYGECVDYCWTELTLRPDTATLVNSSWEDRPPTQTESRAMAPDEWSKLVATIDKAAFLALPEVIGCPDCTDGGGEWIEIDFGSTKKKVTFEANAEIPELAGLTAALRPVRHELTDLLPKQAE